MTEQATSVNGTAEAQPSMVTQATELAAKYIPGLGSLAGTKAPVKPKRSRNKASKATSLTPDAALPTTGESEKPSGLTLESLTANDTLDLPARIPASVIIGKRLKATNKKLQRIEGYTGDSLNQDQQRAVATKPALEAVAKELQDIVKVLETEESEVEKDRTTRSSHEERRTHSRINTAVVQAKESSKSETSLLFQFLHLASLFSPNQGFNTPELPAVVQNANGQEAAAVRMLADAFANGPLLGGGQDAFERLSELNAGEEREVVEGVTYGRIKQMILDLTAPPEELSAESVHEHSAIPHHGQDDLQPEEEDAARQAHSALLNNNGPALTFMQASELDTPQVDSTPVASEGSSWQPTPAAPVEKGQTEQWGEIATPTAPTSTVDWSAGNEVAEGSGAKPISSWADEVDEATAPRKELAPVVEMQPTAAIPLSEPVLGTELESTPVIAEAGRGRGRGRGRGAHRGEQREHRSGEQREPRERSERTDRGPNNNRGGERRGGYRGNNPRTPAATAEPVEDGWNRVEKKTFDESARPRGRGQRGSYRGGERRGNGERRGGAPRGDGTAPQLVSGGTSAPIAGN